MGYYDNQNWLPSPSPPSGLAAGFLPKKFAIQAFSLTDLYICRLRRDSSHKRGTRLYVHCIVLPRLKCHQFFYVSAFRLSFDDSKSGGFEENSLVEDPPLEETESFRSAFHTPVLVSHKNFTQLCLYSINISHTCACIP